MKRAFLWSLGGVAAVSLLAAGGMVLWLSWRYPLRREEVDRDTLRAEITTLAARRDSLRNVVFTESDALSLLEQAPEGDVLVALPKPFVQSIASDVVTGWFGNVDVRLRNLRVRKDGDVRARLSILGRRQVGSYRLDLRLHEVTGRLVPTVPELAFRDDGIGVILPVQLARGSGRGTITFEWDSKGMAQAVCGDLTVTADISGAVRPRSYVARGHIALSATNGTLVADPDFPALAMRLHVVPSASSLRLLRETLESKGKLCDVAVGKANVDDRILALLDRGFVVRIPQRLFRPVAFPIAVAAALPLEGRRMHVSVAPSNLRITEQALWLSAGVQLRPVAAER
jgi:hypothetical protein